jgi:uncharacterized phage infection (PIP) family protein YhgE
MEPTLNDDERSELRERRLVESVTAKVESTLKWRYTGFAIIVVLFAGGGAWTILQQAPERVAKDVQEQVEKAISPLTARALDAVSDARASVTQANVAVEGVRAKIGETDKLTEDITRKLTKRDEEINKNIADFAQQMQDRKRQLEALMESSQQAAGHLAKTLSQVNELATKVESLAALMQRLAAEPGAASTSEKRGDIQAKLSNLQADLKDEVVQTLSTTTERVKRSKVTVYLEYYMPSDDQLGGKDVIHALQEELKQQGFIVPGSERVSIAANDIRYYHTEDADAAKKLQQTVNAFIEKSSIRIKPVEIKDFTKWPRQKPYPGTLELWLSPTE